MKSTPPSVREDGPVRRRQRVHLDTSVCVVAERPHGLLVLKAKAQLLDISGDGAAILAGVDIPIGSNVRFEFGQIFEGRTLKVPAVIRNRRDYIYGVEFLPAIEDEEEQRLRTLKSTLLLMGTAAPGRLGDRRRA